MKILTYNLWHGLAPSSAVSMTALEPTSRLKKRQALQLEVLREISFDVGFFQEVNPLVDRTTQLENVLHKDSLFQSDLVGVKFLGFGLPVDLNSGLLVLADPTLQMRRVQGLKLSGQRSSIVSPWLSLQFKEERFALLGEVLHPEWGRVLVINTHLHHGLEMTQQLEEDLERVCKELTLSSAVRSELFDRVRRGNDRRLGEIQHLLEVVSSLQGRYSVIILGGDFNSRPDSSASQALREFGFLDSFELQNVHKEMFTYDQDANKANHMIQARFPLSVKFDDLTFSDQVRAALLSVFSKNESASRRIDQIWVKADLSLKSNVSLVGLPEPEGFAPSDHFGYLVDLYA